MALKVEFVCPDCRGSGVITYNEYDSELCPRCESRGSIFLDDDEGKEKNLIRLNDYLDQVTGNNKIPESNKSRTITIDDFYWFTLGGASLKCSWDLDTRDGELVSVDIKLVQSKLSRDCVAFEFSITEFKAENDYEADELLKYHRKNLSLSYLNQCLLTKYNVSVDITLEQFLAKIGKLE